MIVTHWHHSRTNPPKGMPAIKISHRQILAGGDSAEPHLLIEEIVLQSLEQLQLRDDGTEHEYPQLRRRK